jgi:hypothetical protein
MNPLRLLDVGTDRIRVYCCPSVITLFYLFGATGRKNIGMRTGKVSCTCSNLCSDANMTRSVSSYWLSESIRVLTQWTCLLLKGGKLMGTCNGGSWGICVERDRIVVRIERQVRPMKRVVVVVLCIRHWSGHEQSPHRVVVPLE